jgi:Zn-dependent peptidase ImmA (M78 family)
MNSLCGYENIAKLIYTIPIFLKEKVEINKEYYRGHGDIVELLGAYFKNIRKNESNPCIELYVDKIFESANGDAQAFKWLFTKTLIHELAHAVLDNYNSEIDYRHVDKISYYTPFGKWREESMANAIALKVIKEFGDKNFYEYAKNYMSTQPAEYALGVLMEDFDYGDLRSVMDNKYEGVSQNLQDEWMNYVQGNPDCEGLKQWNKKLLGLE